MLSAFDLIAILLVLAAAFGFINHRFLRLPRPIGLLMIALAVSLCFVVLDHVAPELHLRASAGKLLTAADLPRAFLNGALSFLLFAAALHVGMVELWNRKWTITLLATIGVILTANVLGVGMWLVFQAIGTPVPLIWCLVLGAVTAPTDPVAVASTLKRLSLPTGIEATIVGESLFNDGASIVLFGALVGIATGNGDVDSGAEFVGAFFLEAVGAGLFGLATGYIAFLGIRQIDEHNLEIIISLALVAGTYSAALALHLSAPIAVVVAGLLTGNTVTRYAMSALTRRHLEAFWSLVDELLNMLLFLLIGFEVLFVHFDLTHAVAALCAIVMGLLSRAAAITAIAVPLHLHRPNKFGAVAVLVWAGVRGGISVALALTLPPGPFRDLILTACYAIVVFTIVVQGLTLDRVVAWAGLSKKNP